MNYVTITLPCDDCPPDTCPAARMFLHFPGPLPAELEADASDAAAEEEEPPAGRWSRLLGLLTGRYTKPQAGSRAELDEELYDTL